LDEYMSSSLGKLGNENVADPYLLSEEYKNNNSGGNNDSKQISSNEENSAS
jgi:hypothetical protein